MDFENLIQRISPKLKGIIALAHYRQGAYFNRDDLYQEALLFLWGQFQKNTLCDKTESYILQGCYFHLKNYLRTSYREIKGDRVLFDEYNDRQEDAMSCDVLDPATLCAPEARNAVFENEFCDTLVDREKEVFLLSLGDMTVREIGQRLGISHVMVLKIKARIRARYDECQAMLA